jgi:hypothetical protein
LAVLLSTLLAEFAVNNTKDNVLLFVAPDPDAFMLLVCMVFAYSDFLAIWECPDEFFET